MARIVRQPFNRGLNLTQPPGKLGLGQAYLIENLRFTKESVKRRGGKLAAYKYGPSYVVTQPVSMLKRYYKIRTSGTIEKYMLIGANGALYKGNSDWSDASPTAGGIAVTLIGWPNTTDNTTWTNVTIDVGNPVFAFTAQNWCYLISHAVAADNTNDDRNIAVRTNGSKSWRHGLETPVAAIYDSEAGGTACVGASTYNWKCTYIYDDGVLGESGLGAVMTHTTAGGGPYDITMDISEPLDGVSIIRIYRQEPGKDATLDPYYLVGEIDVSLYGAWPVSFVDTVPDATLVTNYRADKDIFLPPKYKTACFWKDYCVIGNTKCIDTSSTTELDYEGGGVHKGRIRFSMPFTPDRFRRNSFLDPIPDGDSGELKRLIVNPLLDACFAFYEEDVIALTGDSPLGEVGMPFRPRNIAQSRGTPAPLSVVLWKGDVFYMTKSGIEVISAYRARNITSDSIAPLWEFRDESHQSYAHRINLAQIHKVTAIVNPKTEEIMWFYPAAGSTICNRVLILDTKRWAEGGYKEGIFSIWKDWNIGPVCTWSGEGDNGEIFGGESNGTQNSWVYRIDFSNEDEIGYPDIATPWVVQSAITARLFLGLEPYGMPELRKMFRAVHLEAKSGECGASVSIDVDDGGFLTELGEFEFEDIKYYWDSSEWDVGDWNGPMLMTHIAAIPREAIGFRAGYQFVFADRLDASDNGPIAFELYSISTELEPLPMKVTRGIA